MGKLYRGLIIGLVLVAPFWLGVLPCFGQTTTIIIKEEHKREFTLPRGATSGSERFEKRGESLEKVRTYEMRDGRVIQEREGFVRNSNGQLEKRITRSGGK